jgi:hypothetical protein
MLFRMSGICFLIRMVILKQGEKGVISMGFRKIIGLIAFVLVLLVAGFVGVGRCTTYTTVHAVMYAYYTSSVFYADTDGTAYSMVRGYGNGTSKTNNASAYIGQKLASGNFTVYRCVLWFDTSFLGNSSLVYGSINCTLSVKISADDSAVDFDVVAQRIVGNYPDVPNDVSGYDASHFYGNYGSLSTVGISSATWYNISLSSGFGLSHRGNTTIGLRSYLDIDGAEPVGNEYVMIYGSTYPAKLYIDYAYTTMSGMVESFVPAIVYTMMICCVLGACGGGAVVYKKRRGG